MTDVPHQRFGFDTVFGDDGRVAAAAPRPKRLYPIEEVEAMRQAAFADGERQAMASMEALQAQALAGISDAARYALPTLVEVAHAHRVGSAELAMACGKAIADAALEAFPTEPVRAALESLAREIESAPRLVFTADPALAAGIEKVLEETAAAIGYAGQIQVRVNGDYAPAAFTLDFGDGAASFDPHAASARVSAALHAALAAEGLHAEPLVPGGEG
jgi:flagellar assembly protein FliH